MCSQFLLFLDECFDTIVHVLDKVDFISTKSSEVGDIEDTIIGLGMLSMDTSDLYVVLVSDGLHEALVSHELWKVNMDGGSETSSHVGWAGGDVTEVIIVGEFSFLFDLTGGGGKSLEDLEDVGSLLHGDDSELILLINPHEEGLGIVMEDTSVFGPLSLKSSGLEIFVSTLEKEMIGDKLFLLGIGHGLEGEIFSLKITGEFVKSGNDELLDVSSLLGGNASSEWVGSEVSGNSDSSGVDHLVLIWWESWAFKVLEVHVRDVLVSGLVSVIRLNDSVHEWSEGIVRVVGSSIDTNTGVGPLATGHNSLTEGETEFISSIFALLPDFWSQTFREEGFGTCWEVGESLDVISSLEMWSDNSSSWTFIAAA